MSIIQKTDEWLMSDVFEPLAWRIEYRYGICHCDVAMMCYFLCIASLGLFGVASGNVRVLMIGVLGAPLITLALTPLWIRHKRRPHGVRNPYRDWWVWRTAHALVYTVFLGGIATVIVQSGLAPAGAAIMITAMSCTFHFAYQYFIACDRMPPGYREHEKSLAPSMT